MIIIISAIGVYAFLNNKIDFLPKKMTGAYKEKKDVDDLDNTMMIDDLVVKLNYRFVKKVSNCFIAYISQSCFLK